MLNALSTSWKKSTAKSSLFRLHLGLRKNVGKKQQQITQTGCGHIPAPGHLAGDHPHGVVVVQDAGGGEGFVQSLSFVMAQRLRAVGLHMKPSLPSCRCISERDHQTDHRKQLGSVLFCRDYEDR